MAQKVNPVMEANLRSIANNFVEDCIEKEAVPLLLIALNKQGVIIFPPPDQALPNDRLIIYIEQVYEHLKSKQQRMKTVILGSNSSLGKCAYCGKKDELRPYGKDAAQICYDCGNKPENREHTNRMIEQFLSGDHIPDVNPNDQ